MLLFSPQEPCFLFWFLSYYQLSVMTLWCLPWSINTLLFYNFPVLFTTDPYFRCSWPETREIFCNILWWLTFFKKSHPTTIFANQLGAKAHQGVQIFIKTNEWTSFEGPLFIFFPDCTCKKNLVSFIYTIIKLFIHRSNKSQSKCLVQD